MIKIALDAMGGDNAPLEIIKGALQSLKKFNDIEIVLYGNKDIITALLPPNTSRITIVHTDKYLDMGTKDPLKDFKQKRDSSMFLAMDSIANKTNDVLISAGPTQGLIMGSHLIIKRFEKARKVAICPIIPSLDGRGRLLLDSGANIDIKSENLVDFALYATIVARKLFNIEKPKVGLLNIGVEPGKGRPQDKETFELLSKDKRLNFIGNIEPNTLLDTPADIILNDGFSVNIALKTMEGTAKAVGKLLERNIKSSFLSKIGYLFMKSKIKNLKSDLDASKIGGALLLGLNSTVIKAHGSSDAFAIFNAIRQARDMVNLKIVQTINEELNKIYNE